MTQSAYLRRCFPATHYACDVLTTRGAHELPSCLRFHPGYLQFLSESGEEPGNIVNPIVAEHICGLPYGWTSVAPYKHVEKKRLHAKLAVAPCTQPENVCIRLSIIVYVSACLRQHGKE